MAINFSAIFNKAKAVATLVETLTTAQNVTVKSNVDAILALFSSELQDVDTYRLVSGLVTASNAFSSQSSLISSSKSLLQSEIIRAVQADKPAMRGISVDEAIDELNAQMVTAAQTVKSNTTSASASYPTDKAVLAVTDKLANGLVSQRCFQETYLVNYDGLNLSIRGTASQSNTSPAWPAGSGISLALATSASGGLITNGELDSEDTLATGAPSSWVVTTGTPGTTIKMTDFETQTITIAGTPTAGYYNLRITDVAGNIQTTANLVYNADGATVQSEINNLAGFESATVTTTGTSPNFVHSVKFVGAPGNIPNIVPTSFLDVGTVTQGNGAAVDTAGLNNRTMVWVGNGSQLTTIEQVVSPQALTQYGFCVRMKKQASATGVIEFRLIDGAGNVINDDAGVANSLSVNLSSVSSSTWTPAVAFFRLPSVLPAFVKVQVRLTTAINNTYSLYIDDMTLARVTALGSTGMSVVSFPGVVASATSDAYTLSTANNFAGRIQTLFARFFGRQLPSSGSPTIADT